MGAALIFGSPSAIAKARTKHGSHTQDKADTASTPAAGAPATAPVTQSSAPAQGSIPAGSSAAPVNASQATGGGPTAAQSLSSSGSAGKNAGVLGSSVNPLQVQADLHKDWQDKLGWVLGLILVGFVGVGAWFARKSLTAIEALLQEIKSAGVRADRTVDHVGRQTETALLTAKSVARAERAWIVISVESPEHDRFIFRARNVGKTPARITSIGKQNSAVNTQETKLKIAPEFERGEGLNAIQPFFLPPTASCIIFDYSLKEMGIDGAADKKSKAITIYSYGRVVYSDVTDSTAVHETKWLYMKLAAESNLPFPDPFYPEHNSYA